MRSSRWWWYFEALVSFGPQVHGEVDIPFEVFRESISTGTSRASPTGRCRVREGSSLLQFFTVHFARRLGQALLLNVAGYIRLLRCKLLVSSKPLILETLAYRRPMTFPARLQEKHLGDHRGIFRRGFLNIFCSVMARLCGFAAGPRFYTCSRIYSVNP